MKSIKLYFFIVLFFYSSCFKQKPSSIDSDYRSSQEDIRRSLACQKTNLLDDLLERKNLKNLFRCTKWESKFPKLYKAISNISEEDWNSFFNPINEEVFNKRSNRNLFISLIKDLNRKDGLDDLGKVLTSLTDSNFFNHVAGILRCADRKDCSVENSISNEEVGEFFNFFNLNKKMISHLGIFLGGVSRSFLDEGEKLKDVITSQIDDNGFRGARKDFLNQLFLQFKKESVNENLLFFTSLLESDGEVGWLPKITRERLDEDSFSYLLRYPLEIHQNFWEDFRVLRKALDDNIGCTGDNSLKIDVSSHLKGYLKYLFLKDREDFYRNSSQTIAIFKFGGHVCSKLRNYNAEISFWKNGDTFFHSINFIKVLEKTTRLLLNEDYYEIIKKAHHTGVGSKDDNLFLVKFLSSDVFSSLIELLKVSHENNPKILNGLFSFIKSFPDTSILSLSQILQWIYEKPFIQKRSLERVWSSLGDEGRLFFFNFFDAHFKEDINIVLLFNFYNTFLRSLSTSFEKVFYRLLDVTSKETFLKSLLEISTELGRKELLEEYRQFFSKGHLLDILRVISMNSMEEREGSLISLYQIEKNKKLTRLNTFPKLVESDVRKCLSQFTQDEQNFYSLLNNFPSDCIPFASVDPFFRFLSEIDNMASVVSPEEGFDGEGLFSSETLSLFIKMMNRVSKTYENSNQEGLGNKLDSFVAWINKKDRKKDLLRLLNNLHVLSREDQDFIGLLLNFYSLPAQKEMFGNYLDGLNLLIKKHRNYFKGEYENVTTSGRFTVNESLKCSNYHQSIGGSSCPNSTNLKKVIKRIIRRSVSKYDGQPSALEQLLRLFAIDYGMKIPFKGGSQSFKRLSLREIFKNFFDLSDKSLSINNKRHYYYHIPKADEAFFESPEWRIYRSHTKNSPPKKKVTLNTLERIEIVIRDVRFDENYLGAHYLNAVAKSKNYNNVVSDKYKLLKTCVPLGFCGKFMNRSQKRFAQNSVMAFPSLLDVNSKEGWAYGSFMQALLTALVSSSPKKSQVSNLINSSSVGDKIPWPIMKKNLKNHNGKILTLVSMVSLFSNTARILKDRISTDREQFEKFLNSISLKHIDENFLRNFDVEIHLPEIEIFLDKIQKNGFLDSLIDKFYEFDYQEQRLLEGLFFKTLSILSYLADPISLENVTELEKSRYQNLSILDFFPLINNIVDNHEVLFEKGLLAFTKSQLIAINNFLDVTNYILNQKDEDSLVAIKTINEFTFFLKANKSAIKDFIANFTSNKESLKALLRGVSSLSDLMQEVSSSESNQSLNDLFNLLRDENINYNPLFTYFRLNAAREFCDEGGLEDELELNCIQNLKYRQIQKILKYLFKDDSRRFNSLLEYLSGKEGVKIKEFFNKVFPSIAK